jgi:hypothetical protein
LAFLMPYFVLRSLTSLPFRVIDLDHFMSVCERKLQNAAIH